MPATLFAPASLSPERGDRSRRQYTGEMQSVAPVQQYGQGSSWFCTIGHHTLPGNPVFTGQMDAVVPVEGLKRPAPEILLIDQEEPRVEGCSDSVPGGDLKCRTRK